MFDDDCLQINLTGNVEQKCFYENIIKEKYRYNIENGILSDLTINERVLVCSKMFSSTLKNVDFTHSILSNSKFYKCSIFDSNFGVVALTGSVFKDCKVCASFTQSECAAIIFEKCDLRGSDFSNSQLSFAKFIDCDLSGVSFEDSTIHKTDFINCNLHGAKLDWDFLFKVSNNTSYFVN